MYNSSMLLHVSYVLCFFLKRTRVMQDILDSGTQSDLLAAAQLLKSYNGALQNQVSRHQHAAHILQVLLKEQVTSLPFPVLYVL